MYMIFIINRLYHLKNESKMSNFAYNNDQRLFLLFYNYILLNLSNIRLPPVLFIRKN